MVCKSLDMSKAWGKHSKAFLLCLVEAETTANLSEGGDGLFSSTEGTAKLNIWKNNGALKM